MAAFQALAALEAGAGQVLCVGRGPEGTERGEQQSVKIGANYRTLGVAPGDQPLDVCCSLSPAPDGDETLPMAE